MNNKMKCLFWLFIHILNKPQRHVETQQIQSEIHILTISLKTAAEHVSHKGFFHSFIIFVLNFD